METFKVGDLVEVIGCWSVASRIYIGKRGVIKAIFRGTNPLGEERDGAVLDICTPRTGGFDLIHLRKIPPDSDSKSYIHKDTLKLFDSRKVSNPDREKSLDPKVKENV